MVATAWFVVAQYLWLAGAILSAYGAGTLVMDRCPSAVRWPTALRASFSLTTGLGVLILGLLFLAVTARFQPLTVTLFVAGSGVLGAVRGAHLLRAEGPPLIARGAQALRHRHAWFWITFAALFALPLLVDPLRPPRFWDELMYHLPLARAWARSGSLVVQPELRYPLFPYNFNLLYAAALLYGNDVLPHLLHAFAGIVVALALIVAAPRYFNRPVGFVAALLFLAAARPGFALAYNDLGLTLFVTFGFLALALWYEGNDPTLVVLAALLFGLAVGTKMQALLMAPLFAFWIARRRPQWRTYAAVSAAFAVGGGFWYLRSFAVSGDPLHPFGAPLFGYWLWDRRDLGEQIANIRTLRGPPACFMWPALVAGAWWRGSSGMYRALCATGYAALLLWALSSGYERYLWPAYPLLALMAASVLVRVVDWLRGLRLAAFLGPPAGTALRAIVLSLVAFWSFIQVRHSAALIAPTAAARDAVLRQVLDGYEVFRTMPLDRPWRLYQFGFEGELYYAPVPVVGDWFGPHRYRQVLDRAADPAALAAWLRAEGLNGLVVNANRAPFSTVQFGSGFSDAFDLVLETPTARLYAVRATSVSPVPAAVK